MRDRRPAGTRHLYILTAVAVLLLPGAVRGAQHQYHSEYTTGSWSEPVPDKWVAARPRSNSPATMHEEAPGDPTPAGSATQGSSASGRSGTRRLSISIGTGFARGGPAPDLEDALRQTGLDDTSTGFIGGPLTHPKSDAAFGLVWFDTRYEIRPSWEIGATFDSTRIGRSVGYREGSLQAPPQFVFVYYDVTTIAAQGARRFGPLRLGGGPAYYSTRSAALESDQSRSRSQLGLLAEAGLRLPAGTRVYVDAHLQYRLVGRALVGPITSRAPQAPPGGHPWEGYVPAALPETEARFTHWFIGFGPGVRF